DAIYVDFEEKQSINLLELAKSLINHSKFIAIKPNDIAIESCDLLLRHKYNDDISGKNILVIGTGNLAIKIALRTAERQANVYIHGRSDRSEEHTSELQSRFDLVCRLLLEKKKKTKIKRTNAFQMTNNEFTCTQRHELIQDTSNKTVIIRK